jgi:hypothetical protein
VNSPSKLNNNRRAKMKRLIILTIPLFIILAAFQNSYADTYYQTYELAQIRSDGLILMDSEGNSYLADKDPGKLKIGDSVRWDKVRNVLKKNPWQPAIVTMMGNNTVTLKLNNGEKLNVNMRSQYRGKFKQGDQVLYKKSSGQIKKSNLQKLEEE